MGCTEAFLSVPPSHNVIPSLSLIFNDLLDIATTVSFFVPHPSKCFGAQAMAMLTSSDKS